MTSCQLRLANKHSTSRSHSMQAAACGRPFDLFTLLLNCISKPSLKHLFGTLCMSILCSLKKTSIEYMNAVYAIVNLVSVIWFIKIQLTSLLGLCLYYVGFWYMYVVRLQATWLSSVFHMAHESCSLVHGRNKILGVHMEILWTNFPGWITNAKFIPKVGNWVSNLILQAETL